MVYFIMLHAQLYFLFVFDFPEMVAPYLKCIFVWGSIKFLFLFLFLFYNMCFRNRSIPAIWKKSCIIPVPKKPVISCMNDIRPIALTSVPMKVCERLVLNDLKSKVALHLDPMQFA